MASTKRPIELIGETVGRWFVLGVDETCNKPRIRLVCLCECGTLKSVDGYSLAREDSISCGCYSVEQFIKRSSKHGESETRLFKLWCGMKNRCLNPNEPQYKYYGGRGITITPEWIEDYTIFRDWAIANGYRDDLTIERKDCNGNYCPENCEWIPRNEQSKNRRRPSDQRMVEAWNETKSLSEWVKDDRCVVSKLILTNRVKEGWSGEDAMTVLYPPEVIVVEENRGRVAKKQNLYLIKMHGETKTFTEWAKDDRCVVKDEEVLAARIIRYGWSVKRAFTQPVDEIQSRNRSKKSA